MSGVRPDRCPTGKRSYRSKQLAKAEAKKALRRGFGAERQYPYLCRCGTWHLTRAKPLEH